MSSETGVFSAAFRRFFGILVSGQAWRRLLWLSLAMPLGIIAFTYISVGYSLGLGLLVLIIGLPFLALIILGTRLLAVGDQRLAIALLDAKVAPAPVMPRSVKPGFFRRAWAGIADSFTWRGFVFLLLRLPAGIVAFTVVVTLFSLVGAFLAMPFVADAHHVELFGWAPRTWVSAWACFAAGLLLLPVAFHAVNGLGALSARLVEWMMKPSASSVLPVVEVAATA